MVAISGAERPDELWRWLVGVRATYTDTNTFVPLGAFRGLHEHDPEDAGRTAALLCTDARYRKVTGRLIRGVEASGLVGERELGDLAVACALYDELRWPVPDEWVRDGTVRASARALKAAGPSPVVVLPRPIEPPLRRWGAAWAVRHGRLRVFDGHHVLDIVERLPPRAGDHVLLGLLDAGPDLPADVRDAVIKLGVRWTTGTVRLGALEQLAARDGIDAAAHLAADDRNEKVRGWGAELTQPVVGRRRSALAANPAPVEATDLRDEPAEQASLFDL